ELIARLVEAGPDDLAWPEFFSRFGSRIRLVIYRTLHNEAQRSSGLDVGHLADAVEELAQEVFVRLLEGNRRALASFQGRNENSIYTYLRAIAVNLVRDHFKKLRSKKAPPAAVSFSEPLRTAEGPVEAVTLGDSLATPGPDPEEVTRATELRGRIAVAVDRASSGSSTARDRLIFRLYFEEGLKVDEIAAYPGIRLSSSGVEKRIRRIRDTVEELLAEPGQGEVSTGKIRL
ncbi:MAG: RNA polymerase sigma factor, partial [Acidobacteriota bacterium]